MKVKEFIQKIVNGEVPETIIFQTSKEELKDKTTRFSKNTILWTALEGAKIESVFVDHQNFMFLFSKDGEVYGVDWTDDSGVVFAQYFSDETLT